MSSGTRSQTTRADHGLQMLTLIWQCFCLLENLVYNFWKRHKRFSVENSWLNSWKITVFSHLRRIILWINDFFQKWEVIRTRFSPLNNCLDFKAFFKLVDFKTDEILQSKIEAHNENTDCNQNPYQFMFFLAHFSCATNTLLKVPYFTVKPIRSPWITLVLHSWKIDLTERKQNYWAPCP